jgi:hypothetical protein
MARPIRIPIVSDVTGFIKGTSDVEGALDDVSSSLDDLSREAQGAGDDAGRALSQGIEDGARDAERALDEVGRSDGLEQVGDNADQAAREVEGAADRMEKSFRDAFDTVKKESRDAGRKVGDDVGDGFDRAKEGAQEFKEEANSTARESAASFDGSADSINDTFQEVAANAFAGFGPAGAAAGLAIAAGIGVARSAFDRAKEEAAALRDRIGEIRDGFLAVRVDGDSALRQVSDRMREIVTETEDGAVNIDKLADAAKGLSETDFTDFLAGVAGDPEARQRAIELAERELQLAKDREISVVGVLRGEGRERAAAISLAEERLELLEAQQSAEEEADTERQRQAEREIARTEAEAAAREEKKDAAIRFLEEEAEAAEAFATNYAESVQGAYAEAGSAIDQFVEDGKFNLDEYNTHLETSAEAIRNYQVNIVKASADLSEQALDYVRSLGPEAAPALQAFIDAPNDQKARTAQNWHQQGVIASGAYRQSLAAGIPDSMPGPVVRLQNEPWSVFQQRAQRALNAMGLVAPVRVQTFGNQIA